MSCACPGLFQSCIKPSSQISNDDLHKTSRGFREAGSECSRLAKETMELCDLTIEKGHAVLGYGQEIQSTLVGAGGSSSKVDASALDVIADLMDGDKEREARSLATEMKGLVTNCVHNSVNMILRMEESVDALPDFIENIVERAADNVDISKEEKDLEDVEPNVQELESCLAAVRDLNLATAYEAGTNAYKGISTKSELCQSLLGTIKKYAAMIGSTMEVFVNVNIAGVLSEMKNMLRCIKLGNLIKRLAEAAGRLLNLIVQLMEECSAKLSALWKALTNAKNRLLEGSTDAAEARNLCSGVQRDGGDLQERTDAVSDGLNEDSSSVAGGGGAFLSRANDIREAIGVATNMDDMIATCCNKVNQMVDSVSSGYNELPDIVTDDIPDMVEAGHDEDDPNPADVEEDIRELESAQRAVENEANLLTAVTAARDGFAGASDKVAVTRELLKMFQKFADNCIVTIESFMSSWNLETIKSKIVEMCRLAKLGEMMRQFAVQIQKLLRGLVSFFKAVMDRITNFALDMDALPTSMSDGIEAASKLVSGGMGMFSMKSFSRG